MSASDPSQWPPAGERSDGDSIAGMVASRIEAVPPTPGDALDWAATAARYEREAAALGDRPGVAELLFECGRIHEERLSDPETALGFYRRAMAAGRRFTPNLRALARLAAARGDLPLAAEAEAELERDSPGGLGGALAALEAAEAQGEPGGRLEAHLRCAAALDDPRRAAHHLLAASAIGGSSLGDLEQAAGLALQAFDRCPSDPLVRSAARLHAARTGDLRRLAEVLRAEADATGGDAAAQALLVLARAEERLGEGDRAVASLERAWMLAPDHPRVLSELARLRETRGEWAEASDALDALAAAHLAHGGPGDRLAALAARLRRIEIEESELGRPEEALRCCRDALALDPGQRTALAALGRLCSRGGDWEGLLAACRAEAEAARDPHERAQRTYKAAQVLEERLGRPVEAAHAYRSALAQAPDLLAARSALERLLEREGRWDELCHLIEQDLPAAGPAEQLEALFRLARIEEERKGDGAAAAARYRQVLELDQGNAAALRSLRASLERLGLWRELAEVLGQEAARAAEPARRLALLQRRAEVLEELTQDPERAVAAWEDLRSLRPDHLPALRALGRLYAAAGQWGPVAEGFRAQAAAARDPAQAAELLFRAAELQERRLGRPDAAVPLYREVLLLLPAHLPALQALCRLHRARGEYADLSEALSSLAAAREAPPERAAALAELGELCEERLSDLPRALAAYEEALAVDPRQETALHAAERLYMALGRSSELAALRRSALSDPYAADRPARLLRLAWQEAAPGGDSALAARAAEALAGAAPDSPASALLALRLAADPAQRLAARTALAEAAPLHTSLPGVAPGAPGSDQAALALACQARLAAASDPGSRAAWAVQAGEAWERAGDADRAIAAYQQALAAAPAHLPALRAARHLFAQQRDWGAVRSTLHAEGAALLHGPDGAAAWHEAGIIAEQWFGDVDGAVRDYRAALGRDPSDPVALTRVEALLAPAGLAELADVHAARAQAEPEPGRAADAWMAAARARLDGPDGQGAALHHLDRALELRPDHAGALALRARLRAQAGQAAPALDDLQRCLALGGDPASQAPLHLSAAALWEEDLHDPAAALRHVEAALTLAPESVEALARLARLHQGAGRLPAAAAALRRLEALAGLSRQEQIDHGFALASVEADMGELDPALASCRKVLLADPGHPGALRLRVELARRRGDPADLAEALAAAASGARDPAVRSDAHLEAARLHAGPLASRPQAVEHLRAALELEPEREEIRATLAEVAEEGQPSLALEQHRRLLSRDPCRVASWTALYRLFGRTRSHDGAYVAATVLRWLGVPTPGPAAEQLLLEGDRLVPGRAARRWRPPTSTSCAPPAIAARFPSWWRPPATCWPAF